MQTPQPPDSSAATGRAFSDTEPLPLGNGPGYQPRQLLLLGAGHAHIHVLAQLAVRPLVGVRITLVAPFSRQLYADMLPGLVAGGYKQDACQVPLEPLVRRSGVRWLKRSVRALRADQRTVELDDGSELQYDWLSVNTGPVQHRTLLEERMPGAREFGLFLRPIESFATLWPKVARMGDAQALRFAVIGGGPAGIEIALAIRRRLPASSVTLLNAGSAPGSEYAPGPQNRLLAALRAHRVTVIIDNVTAIQRGEVQLESGATLRCDVPLIATAAQAAPWLADSGLHRDAKGFILVDPYQRSTSHPEVFAVGDVCQRVDRVLPRSGVSPLRTGPVLLHNLSAVANGRKLRAHQPAKDALSILSCSDGRAVAIWGRFSAEGRWVWWLKRWLNWRMVARFTRS